MQLAAQLDDAGTRSADAVARLWRAGELSAKKDGIGVYKVPLCLAALGQHGLANNGSKGGASAAAGASYQTRWPSLPESIDSLWHLTLGDVDYGAIYRECGDGVADGVSCMRSQYISILAAKKNLSSSASR